MSKLVPLSEIEVCKFIPAGLELMDCDIVLLWSGGADSTLLLYKLLDVVKGTDKKIYAISVMMDGLDYRKVYKEKQCRENILDRLKSEGIYNVVNEEVKLELPKTSRTYPKGLVQPVIWLANCIPFMSDYTKLFLGYHRGDDFWYLDDKFVDALNSLALIAGKRFDFYAPLGYMNKEDILKELNDRGIEDFWFCEEPNGFIGDNENVDSVERCGQCTPCKTYDRAMHIINMNKESLKVDSVELEKGEAVSVVSQGDIGWKAEPSWFNIVKGG